MAEAAHPPAMHIPTQCTLHCAAQPHFNCPRIGYTCTTSTVLKRKHLALGAGGGGLGLAAQLLRQLTLLSHCLLHSSQLILQFLHGSTLYRSRQDGQAGGQSRQVGGQAGRWAGQASEQARTDGQVFERWRLLCQAAHAPDARRRSSTCCQQ